MDQTPPPFEHFAYVDGGWFTFNGSPASGLTQQPYFSWVFYPNIVNGAELALSPYKQMPDFTPPFSDTASMRKLITAIGTGLGNTAAHETGHQLSFKIILRGMECGPGSPTQTECQDGINSVYESASQGDWTFLVDFKPPIHWEPEDLNSLQNNLFNCNATACPK